MEDTIDLIEQDKRHASEQRIQKLLRHEEIEDFKKLLNTKEGRRFFWRLLSKTGIFHCGLYTNEEAQFRNGARNVGNEFWIELQTLCPEKYHLMVKEQKDAAERNAASRN